MDIGAYYNPINLFFKDNFCPSSVVVVEPILDALSAIVPCQNGKSTHYLFLPITFKYYLRIKDMVPQSDSVVCIGCDSHYGPNRKLLETSFLRPYKLFLEYPSEYVHNTAFKKMLGTGTSHFVDFWFDLCLTILVGKLTPKYYLVKAYNTNILNWILTLTYRRRWNDDIHKEIPASYKWDTIYEACDESYWVRVTSVNMS